MRQKYINCEGWRWGGREKWSLNLKQLIVPVAVTAIVSPPPPSAKKKLLCATCVWLALPCPALPCPDLPCPVPCTLHSANPTLHPGYITFLCLRKNKIWKLERKTGAISLSTAGCLHDELGNWSQCWQSSRQNRPMDQVLPSLGNVPAVNRALGCIGRVGASTGAYKSVCR